MPSSRFIPQRTKTSFGWNSKSTALITRAAKTARGIYVKRGVRKSSVTMTVRLATILEIPVFAPTEKLMAVRENDPLTG